MRKSRWISLPRPMLMLVFGIPFPRLQPTSRVSWRVEVVEPICAPGAEYFSTILWVYKGGLNLFGVVMAGKTWHCADGVGESQSICLSVYNTTLLGLLNVGMHLLANDNIVAESGVRSFSAVGGTVFTVSVVFGPKAYKV